MGTTTPKMSFGDNVHIVRTPATEERKVADLVGQIYGFTTPSVTGVEVIGGNSEDFAFNVFFEESQDSLWFARDLVEFVNHGAGTEASVTGSPFKFVRSADGDWIKQPKHSKPDSKTHPLFKKPWWRFW